MSMSVVNGYLCFDSCEATKAASGKNPRPQTGQPENDFAATSVKSPGARGETPATTLARSLTDLLTTDAVAPSSASTATKNHPVQPRLDVLA